MAMHNNMPFSQACENNKAPILAVLRQVFTAPGLILEIGAGTGQHAVHFAASLPHLTWQPSDHPDNCNLSQARINAAALDNLRPPLALDVTHQPWPLTRAEGIFSANTAHIMHWPEVEAMFRGAATLLSPGGHFCLYGPFNYGGQYTSESNARFDRDYLKARDPGMGIRDLDDLKALAEPLGLRLQADHAMPANNRTLVWRRAAQ